MRKHRTIRGAAFLERERAERLRLQARSIALFLREAGQVLATLADILEADGFERAAHFTPAVCETLLIGLDAVFAVASHEAPVGREAA